MISTLFWVLLHMSGYIIVMIVDDICGWVSAPVFPSYSYLDSPKGGSSLGPDHGMNFTTNLGSPPSTGAGISLAVIEIVSCTTWAWPHISPTPCCNGLHNQLSSNFLCPIFPFSIGNNLPYIPDYHFIAVFTLRKMQDAKMCRRRSLRPRDSRSQKQEQDT